MKQYVRVRLCAPDKRKCGPYSVAVAQGDLIIRPAISRQGLSWVQKQLTKK